MKSIPTFISTTFERQQFETFGPYSEQIKFLKAYKQKWKVESNKNRRGEAQLKTHEIKINYEADSHGHFFQFPIPRKH